MKSLILQFNFLLSCSCFKPKIIIIGFVLIKKMHNGRPIGLGHLSDSGNLKNSLEKILVRIKLELSDTLIKCSLKIRFLETLEHNQYDNLNKLEHLKSLPCIKHCHCMSVRFIHVFVLKISKKKKNQVNEIYLTAFL